MAASILAASLASAAVALFAGAVIAKFCPLAEGVRDTLAFMLVIPLWVGVSCWVFAIGSAAHAWGFCAGALLLLGGLLLAF